MAQSDVDIRDVVKGLDRLRRVPDRDAAIFFRELKREARAELLSHRRDVQGRAKSTVAKHGPGRKLGKVPSAYRWRADESGLDGLSRVPFSAVLDQGGVVGNRARVPARPYAFWSNGFVSMAADRYARFAVRRGWRR